VPFGITPLHVILVLIIGLIILGPRMLPRVGSAAGRSIREFRHAVPATRDAFVSEVAPRPDPGAGGGTALGAKVGSAAGRSFIGFRNAVSGARDGFQAEVAPASPPPAVTATLATPPVVRNGGASGDDIQE
jgi:TatA/E family protein of Tat protein translocase